MSYQPGTDHLLVSLIPKSQLIQATTIGKRISTRSGSERHQKISLFEIDEDEFTIPEFKPMATLRMLSTDFATIMEEITKRQKSEDVILQISKEQGLKIVAKGDRNQGTWVRPLSSSSVCISISFVDC